MQFQIPFSIPAPTHKILCQDKILLMGSCFTEHIGARFSKYGWATYENPNGILFNPNSILKAIRRYAEGTLVQSGELFQHLELWHHWDFHSRFSHIDKTSALEGMNVSIQAAHHFLKSADWIIITLGSAFQYFELENEYGVGNCHRVPANQFSKRLLPIDDIVGDLKEMMQIVKKINPSTQFLFTISPVRHIKDGVIENNVSKARLIEAVYEVCQSTDALYYPAYEILIDVLRDYRYYDTDLVHPNYAATQYVWEFLGQHFFEQSTNEYLKEMISLIDAYQHRTRFPDTEAHRTFLKNNLQKTKDLQLKYPHLQLEKIIKHFSS